MRDAWAAKDSPWRQGLMQRLEDIDVELERQAPQILAAQAERFESPSSYQRQCHDILERLRRDCAVLDSPAGATPIEETAARPVPTATVVVPPSAAPIDFAARLGSLASAVPRSELRPAPAAGEVAPAHTLVQPGSILPLLDRIAQRAATAHPNGAPFGPAGANPVTVRLEPQRTDMQEREQAVHPQIDPQSEPTSAANELVTNETILAYASTSGVIADRMARRLKVGLWVGSATCGVALASLSALFVATMMDASQSTSTVHALPAGVAVPPKAVRTVALAPPASGNSEPDYSGLGSALGWIRANHAMAEATTQAPVRTASLTHAAAPAVEKAVFRAEPVASLRAQSATSQRPRLIADIFVRREDAAAIPISLQLDGASSSDFERHAILVRDLPAGAALSVGSRVGPRTWSLPIGAIETARLTLPPNAAETTDLRVELVDPVGEPVTRTRLRIRMMTSPGLGPNPEMIAALQAEKAKLAAALEKAEKKLASTAAAQSEAVARAEKAAADAARVAQAKAKAKTATAAKPVEAEVVEEEAPAPVKRKSSPAASSSENRVAKLPSRPSALGASSQTAPASGQANRQAPASSGSISGWVTKSPDWSPFLNGGGSR